MSANGRQLLSAFGAALLFGLGLGLSGMTLPAKVLGFLDITGDWDPSLAFVMVGATGVHAVVYRLSLRRRQPVLAPEFHRPTATRIDGALAGGAFLFGVGWGLGGFCPGPGIVAATTGHAAALVFVGTMLLGVVLFQRLFAKAR